MANEEAELFEKPVAALDANVIADAFPACIGVA